MNKYKVIIGFEIHIELSTRSKMFCSCDAWHFQVKPNTKTCPTCLGLPGGLPVANEEAIKMCVKMGLALGCSINKFSKFDRKNYFYPDLAKGYQISQYDLPFCYQGEMEVDGKKIGITRVHLEEDTAKMIHDRDGSGSLVDFNRSGVALMEVVTEPDIDGTSLATTFLKKLQNMVRYLGLSDCDMEKGRMRCEPNISLSCDGKLPDYKVEIKNVNSFRYVKKAIEYEIERQSKILEKGEVPAQETRGFDEKKQVTFSQRLKEEANDYRYFPEPDIPPIEFSDKEIEEIRKEMEELPDKRMERYKKDYGVDEANGLILIENRELGEFFERVVRELVIRGVGKEDFMKVAKIVVNRKVGKDDPEAVDNIEKIVKGLGELIDEDESVRVVDEVFLENEKAVNDLKRGKENAVMFLMGQVMKKTKGKVKPGEVILIIREKANG